LAYVGRGLPIDEVAILQERDSGHAADRVGYMAWQLARLRQHTSGLLLTDRFVLNGHSSEQSA
jgi:hypothetical protein